MEVRDETCFDLSLQPLLSGFTAYRSLCFLASFSIFSAAFLLSFQTLLLS